MFPALWLAIALWLPQGNPYPQQYQAGGFGTAPVRELKPTWTLSLPGPVAAASIAPDGSCIAVVSVAPTPGRIVLIDRNGQRLWDFAPPAIPTSVVAVAPGCAWVAFDATRESDRRAVDGQWTVVDTGRVAVRRRDGTVVEILVSGRPDSIAISPAADLIAIGSEVPKADGNAVTLASPDGRIVHTARRRSYQAPRVVFSRDGQFVVVSGWYGVGVLSRTGERVWGPWTTEGGQPGRRDWRGIDASRDLKWFAAAQGPMHGPDGGSYAILSSTGEVAWEGPSVWAADARIAPDGSFFVSAGLEMRSANHQEDEKRPARVAVMDRAGRVLAASSILRPMLEGVTDDGRYILIRETDATGRPWLVGRDRSLAPAWRVLGGDRCAVSLEGSLIVTWSGERIAGLAIPM
jgi:hypothetical protein